MKNKEAHIELTNPAAKDFLNKIIADKEAAFEKMRTPEAIASIKKSLTKKK